MHCLNHLPPPSIFIVPTISAFFPGEDSSTNDLDSVLKNYMQVILAGLAGNPTVINCTILAITRIFYEFRDIFPDDLMEMVVTNVCLLLTSQSREVVGASLSFLHVFVTTNDVLKSAPHVEGKCTADKEQAQCMTFRLAVIVAK